MRRQIGQISLSTADAGTRGTTVKDDASLDNRGFNEPALDESQSITADGEIVITTATEADIPGIQYAAAESWRAAYSGIYSPDFIEAFVGRAYSSESLRRVIHSTRSIFVVAREGDSVIGFSHGGIGSRNAELYRIYLRPAWWGSGVGEKMLRHTEAWLRAEGYTGYGCFVHRQNAVGQRFYERQGFRHLTAYDEKDELYLWKDLGGA